MHRYHSQDLETLWEKGLHNSNAFFRLAKSNKGELPKKVLDYIVKRFKNRSRMYNKVLKEIRKEREILHSLSSRSGTAYNDLDSILRKEKRDSIKYDIQDYLDYLQPENPDVIEYNLPNMAKEIRNASHRTYEERLKVALREALRESSQRYIRFKNVELNITNEIERFLEMDIFGKNSYERDPDSEPTNLEKHL